MSIFRSSSGTGVHAARGCAGHLCGCLGPGTGLRSPAADRHPGGPAEGRGVVQGILRVSKERGREALAQFVWVTLVGYPIFLRVSQSI